MSLKSQIIKQSQKNFNIDPIHINLVVEATIMDIENYLLDKIKRCNDIMNDPRLTIEGYNVTKGKAMAFEEMLSLLK